MTTKKSVKGKSAKGTGQKKLRLNKETLMDLTAKGDNVQGGVRRTPRCAACTNLASGCN